MAAGKPWADHETETFAAMHGLLIQAPYAIGETWYVKLPGGTTLLTLKITDVTDKTVEFEQKFTSKSRYIKSEITFVEKAR